MKKLVRHTSFEALKSATPSAKPTQNADTRIMSDFENFLIQLHSKFSSKKRGGKYVWKKI